MTDILDRIDDAVQERCACGCGRPLDPNGPSGWFADQGCQWRWANRNATQPSDVYNRPDANGDNIDLPVRNTDVRTAGSTIAAGQMIESHPDGTVHPRTGTVYQPWEPAPLLRWCRHCHTAGRPHDGWSVTGLNMGSDGAPLPMEPGDEIDIQRTQLCEHCRRPYPGPRLTARRRDDFIRDQIVVRLEDGTRYVEARINYETTHLAADPQAFMADIYRQMEARLARFWPDMPGEPDEITDIDGALLWQDGPIGSTSAYESWLRREQFMARHFPPNPRELFRIAATG